MSILCCRSSNALNIHKTRNHHKQWIFDIWYQPCKCKPTVPVPLSRRIHNPSQVRTCTLHQSKHSCYPPKFLNKSIKFYPDNTLSHENSPTIPNFHNVRPATINIFKTLFSCKVFILDVFNVSIYLTTDTFGKILLVCNMHSFPFTSTLFDHSTTTLRPKYWNSTLKLPKLIL